MMLPFLSLMVLEREAFIEAELPIDPELLDVLLPDVLGDGTGIAPEALLLVDDVLLPIVPLSLPEALLPIAPLEALLSIDEELLPIAPLSLPEVLLLMPLSVPLELALLEVPLALLSVDPAVPPPDALFSVELLCVVVLVVLLPPLLRVVCSVVVVSASSSSTRPFRAYQAAPANTAKTMAPNTRFRVLPFSPSKRGTKLSSQICSKRPR